MALLAQKVDVAEEMDRLDFMMQEFNREASKSISAEVTAAAVELKVLIEQMGEQIQNVE